MSLKQIIKTLLILVLVLAPLLSFGRDNPYSDEAWLSEGFTPQLEKFKRVSLTPHPEHNGIIIANCETDLSWWGRIQVFHHTDNKIDWIATFPKDYDEDRGCYVLSCEWQHLEKLDMWILEVFDSTHMGNGNLWLFELKGHNFHLLLHTTARGHFLTPPPDLIVPRFGGTCLVEDHLSAEYRIPAGATTEAEGVFLTGTIAALDQGDKEQSRKPYTETWTWNASKHIFVQLQP